MDDSHASPAAGESGRCACSWVEMLSGLDGRCGLLRGRRLARRVGVTPQSLHAAMWQPLPALHAQHAQHRDAAHTRTMQASLLDALPALVTGQAWWSGGGGCCFQSASLPPRACHIAACPGGSLPRRQRLPGQLQPAWDALLRDLQGLDDCHSKPCCTGPDQQPRRSTGSQHTWSRPCGQWCRCGDGDWVGGLGGCARCLAASSRIRGPGGPLRQHNRSLESRLCHSISIHYSQRRPKLPLPPHPPPPAT
jgi:hypothetical protein